MPISTEQFEDMKRRMAKNIHAEITGKPVDRERDLHDAIEADLKNRRFYYVHSRMDKASTQQAGVTDFIIAAPDGVTIWIECKKRGNKLSKEQTITRHILLGLNHHYATVYSFEEYTQAINAINKRVTISQAIEALSKCMHIMNWRDTDILKEFEKRLDKIAG